MVDTSVLIAALRSGGGASLDVLLACDEGRLVPIVGAALYAEYRAVANRGIPRASSPLTRRERIRFVDGFASSCEW